MSERTSVVVIGAGPAGLSAAHHLQAHDVTVLERGHEPGGLCRSFEVNDATFDFGGHAFFTRHDEIRDLVARSCKVGIHEQQRRAWVFSHGTYVRYPFQSHLHGLPVDVVRDCLAGLFEAARDAAGPTPANLADWILRSFGAGVGQHFLTPYNEKLWAYPLTDIAPTWTSDRIVLPDVAAIIEGALAPTEFRDFVNARVCYPAEGGFARLYEGLVDGVIDRIRFDSSVDRVDLEARTITTDGGRQVRYDVLISTMPLNELLARAVDAPSCCRAEASHLEHNSLHLVNVVVRNDGVTDMQRVYAASPEIPFHKLVLNSNSSPSLRARPVFGIQAEVSFSRHKHVDRSRLDTAVIDSLLTMGIVKHASHVEAVTTTTVPYAYPVYTADTASTREHLLSMLADKGILCAGRFGEWLYINSDDAVLRGKARAEEAERLLAGERP